MRRRLKDIYDILLEEFGPQYWWPAKTRFEVIVGAILTQNTSWSNVEKAINNLKRKRLVDIKKIAAVSPSRLAPLIRPSGYYNIKAKRLKAFVDFLIESYSGSIRAMKKSDPSFLRESLLAVNGIGPETADSILLYALDKPFFVVDAYTKRFLARHRMISDKADYGSVQRLFMDNLNNDVKLFNEYHALLVRLGKQYCLKKEPKCDGCPLKRWKR